MKKYLPVITVLLLCAFAVEGSVSVIPALVNSVVVILACLLAALCMKLVGKLILGGWKTATAAVLGFFWASAIEILLSAFAYSIFKEMNTFAVSFAAAVIMAAAFGCEEKTNAKVIRYACAFALCTIITAVIRELFGAASFAGIFLRFLYGIRCTALVKVGGGYVVLAIVMACLKKLLPEEITALSFGKLLPIEFSSRISNADIPAAFKGAPILALVSGFICFAVFAFL